MNQKKTKAIWVRVTNKEHEKICQRSELNQYKNVSSYARDMLLNRNQELEETLTYAIYEVKKVLAKLHLILRGLQNE